MRGSGDSWSAPIVARDGELRVVETAVRRLTDGQGGAIGIVGPAGVGKSRLAREAAAIAQVAGTTMLTGRAVATGASTAYRPLVEALAPWSRTHPASKLDLGPHHRALDVLMPSSAPVTDALSPVFVAEALLRLLPHIGRDGPVMLVVEDLHWADDETLAAVEYLADASESLPLLVVLTARDDQGPASRRLVRSLASRGSLRLVPVGPFDATAVRDLAELRLGRRITQPLHDLLVARAEGLPLFVEELLAALDASGGFRDRGDEVDVDAAAASVLPETVADTVAARMEVMDDPDRRVLETAALLGRAFAHDDVVAANPGADVEGALLRGLDVGLLHEDPDRPGQLRFRHALLRDGVVASTFPPRRADLARCLLELLLTREPTDDELAVAVELAARAGDNAHAARLALQRAMNAFELWAMATSEHGLAEARSYAGTDPDLLIEIDVAQMKVASIMGRLPVVMQLGRALLSRLDPAGGRHDAELLETHLRLGQTLLIEEQWQEAQPHMEAAATLMHAADPCQVSRLEHWWSLLARLRGDAREAVARAVRAADLARPDPYQADIVCSALLYEGRAWLPDVDTARARWRESLEYADNHGLRLWRAHMLVELTQLELDELTGDMSMDDVLREADELARECGGWDTRTRIALMRVRLGLLRGDVDGALAAMVTAEALGVAGALSRRAHADLSGALAVLQGDPRDDTLTAAAKVFAALVDDDDETAQTLAKDPDVDLTSRRGPLALFVDVADVDAAGFGAVVAARDRLPDLSAAVERLAEAPLIAAFFVRMHATGVAADRDALLTAVSTFDRLGLARPADACRAMLREAGVPLPRRSSAMDGVPAELRALGITTRELDVLRLLAQGRSNRDIAAGLYLSPRTVEKHVERLLMKTGAANRTELAGLLRAGAETPS